MNSVASTLGVGYSANPLRLQFLKWQCHVRQMSMRQEEGRPSDPIMPAVMINGAQEPLGHIITVLNKAPGYSVTAELEFMRAKTNDPAQVRESAIKFLSATYYQRHREFSDILTATFPPGSEGAARLRAADRVTLVFEAYGQRYDLGCKVWKLASRNPLYRSTIAHNRLFNPGLPGDTVVLAFEPDWNASSSAKL